MYITESNLDDLLIRVYKRILNNGKTESATKGKFKEITGTLIKLENPRSRLSRAEGKGKLFSCLGELAWYLSGSNKLDFIAHYIPRYEKSSDDNETIYGGYGPRMMGEKSKNQIKNVIKILQDKPTSRQAVIQLFDSEDILGSYKDIPCTCTLQFLIRDQKLHMFTHMRSNDAYLGLPHDIFAFTMIQEIVARSTGCKLGEYKHYVCSLHIYEENQESAKKYVTSGYQNEFEMPEMPPGDPWQSIETLLRVEKEIREGRTVDINSLGIDDYWKDLARVFNFFTLTKEKSDENKKLADAVLKEMSNTVYSSYLERRQQLKASTTKSAQAEINFDSTEESENA